MYLNLMQLFRFAINLGSPNDYNLMKFYYTFKLDWN